MTMPRPGRWQARRSIGVVLAGLITATLGSGAGWLLGERTLSPEQFVGGPIKIMVYEVGRPIDQQTFTADSPKAKLVTQWLSAHPGGWTINLISHAPQRKINGERFNLNFFSRSVIPNYQIGPSANRMQVSRAIEPGDIPDVFGPPRPK